jgi:hypothetical protein
MRYHTGSLGPLIASFNVQVYDHAYRQFLKGDTLHSAGMKVHFTAGVGLNEPVTALDKQAHNPSPRTRARLLHDPTALDTIVLYFSIYSIKHRIHGAIERLSGFAGIQGLASQRHDDACLIGSLDMMRSLVEHHPGVQNVIVWCVEFFETFADPVVQCGLDVSMLPSIYICIQLAFRA